MNISINSNPLLANQRNMSFVSDETHETSRNEKLSSSSSSSILSTRRSTIPRDLNIKNGKMDALIDKISQSTIQNLLDQEITVEDKRILFRTFEQISQKISPTSENIYFKRTLKKTTNIKKQINTRAYGISRSGIYLCKQTLGKGTYKQVHSAIRISFINEPFSEQVESCVRIKPNPKLVKKFGVSRVNNYLLKESNDMMVVLAENPYAVQPLYHGAYSISGKAIFIQKQYSGNGWTLINASFQQQLKALKELGLGLALLHEKGFVHMDIKPANLFIQGNVKDSEAIVEGKMADIGLVKAIGEGGLAGTPHYLPPEVVKFQPLSVVNGKKTSRVVYNQKQTADIKIDSYALGMTMIAIMLSESVKKQIATDITRVRKPENKLTIPFSTRRGPLFIAKENKVEFEAEVKNFLRLAFQALKKVKDPDIAKRREALKICEALISFDPSERITCQIAALRLEKIRV